MDGAHPDQRVVEASAVLPPYGAVTGWAALRWGGARWFDGTDPDGARRPVPLAVMHSEIRSQPGILVTSERLPPRDLTTHDGVTITTHVRSVCFEMRYAASERDAVEALDMAMTDDLVTLGEVATYVAGLKGWIGVGLCRVALGLADENSWSPMETRLRLVWLLDLGFPPLLTNRPVFDLDGRHVATPDLLDPEAGLVIEYEGALHLAGRRRGRDLQREAALRRVGLEYVVATAADWRSPQSLLWPRLVEARRRAPFDAEGSRRWTLEPPQWWRPTASVEARRSLSVGERKRFLRYRAG